MTKQYETVFIMTPVLSEEQMKETVKKFKDIIKAGKAKIVHEEDWKLKKLAYTVQKKNTGFYYLIEYTADNADFINKMEVEFKRDERIMRFLTVKLDKHAIAYNEKKRKAAKAAKTVKAEA